MRLPRVTRYYVQHKGYCVGPYFSLRSAERHRDGRGINGIDPAARPGGQIITAAERKAARS